jgi:hypothetical protein
MEALEAAVRRNYLVLGIGEPSSWTKDSHITSDIKLQVAQAKLDQWLKENKDDPAALEKGPPNEMLAAVHALAAAGNSVKTEGALAMCAQ